jgi:ribosomal protein L31
LRRRKEKCLEVQQRNGKRCTIVLSGCKYVPELRSNLFSITTALAKGWQLSNHGIHIQLNKGHDKIVFDTIDPTSQGILMTVKMIPKPLKQQQQQAFEVKELVTDPMEKLYEEAIRPSLLPEDYSSQQKQSTTFSTPSVHPHQPKRRAKPLQKQSKSKIMKIATHQNPNENWTTVQRRRSGTSDGNIQDMDLANVDSVRTPPPNTKKMDINKFHSIAGHVHEKSLRATTNYYGIVLQGQLKPCIQCTLAKIHKTPISKDTVVRSTVPGERIYIDISKLSHPSTIGSKFWLLVVDDATDFTWSFFLKAKSDTTDTLVSFFN